MKVSYYLSVGFIVLMSCFVSTANSAQTNQRTLLVLGDSISAAYGMKPDEGWVVLLREKLSAQDINTVNASISGETTAGGLARVPSLLDQYQPSWVIVELGGNDGLRGYPITRMKQNLADIIEKSQAADAEVLLIGMQIPPNYGKRYTKLFSDAFPSLAKRFGIELVPTFLESVAVKPDAMQADGIHPNASAQKHLLEVAWPAIVKMTQTP